MLPPVSEDTPAAGTMRGRLCGERAVARERWRTTVNPDTRGALVSSRLVVLYAIRASVCGGKRMRDVREGEDPKCHWDDTNFGR